MSRIELPKLTQHVLIGPDSGAISVSKLTMHVWMIPDPNPPEVSTTRQGHVYVQYLEN